MTTPAVIRFDGGARPSNPGPAANGYIIETDHWSEKGYDHIGESTNNRAEYRALMRGLGVAPQKGCTEVEAKGDSQLVLTQIRGEWSVNEPELRPLRDRARELAEGFEQFDIQHVPREENWEADELIELGFSNPRRSLQARSD